MEWGHALRFYTYVVPKERDLKNGVALAYGDSLGGKKRKIRKVLHCELVTASAFNV